jgi:hypothetical protein
MADTEQAQERQLPVVRSMTPTEQHLAAETGMKARELDDGTRVWGVQVELRQRYNVMAPISTVAQVDSNWSPLPKIVIITPGGAQTFKVGWSQETGDIHSLQRAALDALAEASGINIHRQWTERFEGGFKVNVVTRRRRADGLWDQRVRGCEVIYADLEEEVRITKEENWTKYNKAAWEGLSDAERQKVLAGGRLGKDKRDAKPPPTELELRKEILRERKFAPRKAETTAFGRCVRAHLGMPSSFPVSELSKPFLCFTWVLTPDYSRTGTRELVRQLHTDAGDAIYGEDRTMAIQDDLDMMGGGPLPHELPDSTITHIEDDVVTESDPETGEVVHQHPVEEGPVEEDEPEFDFEDPTDEERQGEMIAEPEHGFTIAKRHKTYGGQHVRDVVKDGDEGWNLIASMAKAAKTTDHERDLCLAWLSWASQDELSLDDLN